MKSKSVSGVEEEGNGPGMRSTTNANGSDGQKPQKGTFCCKKSHHGRIGFMPCAKKATVIRDGQPYCSTHDPDKIAVRQALANARYAWEDKLRDLKIQRSVAYGLITKTAIAHIRGTASIEELENAVYEWEKACNAVEDFANAKSAS